jgi:hypothetical protein
MLKKENLETKTYFKYNNRDKDPYLYDNLLKIKYLLSEGKKPLG